MNSRTLIVIFTLAILTLAGCTSAGGQSEADLIGKLWVLESLNGSAPAEDTLITAEFTNDGMASGTSGCNRYTGKYTVNGNQIQFEGSIASTMMACMGPVMDQEIVFFQALNMVKSFIVENDQLSFKDADGKILMTFAVQSQNLEETSWTVINFNNGQQAITSSLAETELTVDFGKDGNLSGSAGCNNFMGSYEIDGAKITISPLALTKKLCNEPEGVMDQETQFTTALQSAASYKVIGQQLEMRTDTDALAVSFQRK